MSKSIKGFKVSGTPPLPFEAGQTISGRDLERELSKYPDSNASDDDTVDDSEGEDEGLYCDNPEDSGIDQESDSDSEEKDDPTLSETLTLCPRCGHNMLRQDMTEITEEDKKEFKRYILSGRYVKKFERLSGGLTVKMRAPTKIEVDEILIQLKDDIKSERITNDVEYLCWHSRYRLVMSLESISTPEETINYDEYSKFSIKGRENADYAEDATCLRMIYDIISEEWSEPLYNMLVLVESQFRQEIDVMTQRAWSPDF